MRSRIVLLFVLALVCAGGAAYLVMKKMRQMEQPVAAQTVAPTSPILIATRNLPTGTVVAQADVRVMDWPAGSWPIGGMAPDSIVFGETVVKLPIAQNTPLIDTQVVRKGEGGALAYVVPPGRVAMSVLVDAISGVGGHVGPGNFVDVLFVHGVPEELAGDVVGMSRVSETLLVGVKVLAIDLLIDDVNPQAQVVKTVTLELSPKEAEMLTLADISGGALRLTLNSAVEPSPADLLTVADVRRGVIPSFTTEKELSAVYVPIEDPQDDSEAQVASHKVFVFRGSAVQEVSLPAAGMPGAKGNGQGHGGTDGQVVDASDPSAGKPAVEAEGDADEESAPLATPAAQQGTAGEPQQLLPEKIDLRGGSS